MELTTPEPIHIECKRFSGVLSLSAAQMDPDDRADAD